MPNDEPKIPHTEDERSPAQRLRDLANTELSPFLDAQGSVQCFLKDPASPESSTVWPMGHELISSFLTYRYSEVFPSDPLPGVREHLQAKALICGQLLKSRGLARKPADILSHTVELIVAIAQQQGDYQGSCEELLKRLKGEANNRGPLPTGPYKLPNSATQLGLVLSKAEFILRARCIELYRPQRQDRKRLWAWTVIHPVDDGSVTSAGELEDESPRENTAVLGGAVGTDGSTVTDEELVNRARGGNRP